MSSEDKYNGDCPSCGSRAYIGFNKIECCNSRCKHYKKGMEFTSEDLTDEKLPDEFYDPLSAGGYYSYDPDDCGI